MIDLGLLNQVGGFLGEDELPETRPEPVPVVLHHRYAVLWDGQTHSRSAWMKGRKKAKYISMLVYLDVLMPYHLKHFDAYVLSILIE